MSSLLFQPAIFQSLRAHQHRVAIEENTRTITYEELLSAAEKVTVFLLEMGLNHSESVGIALDNRYSLIAAIIGTANAACVFVPIDHTLPEERITAMIADMGLQHLLVSKVNMPKFTGKDLNCYEFEAILNSNMPESAVDYPLYNEDDSIYIYFTSGTTGHPKGIVGKNCSLLQFLQWEIKRFDFGPGTRFSQFINPFFDAFLRDIFVPLLCGGTIVVPPVDKSFFIAESMTDWIEEHQIQVIHCVPSLFRQINSQSLTSENFRFLTHVLLSGERIIPGELQHWYNTFDSRIQLVNFYGTTETTMIRFCYQIEQRDVEKTKIPIGAPIDGTDFLISNDGVTACKMLVPGELYIISRFITKGYLNDEALTAEKFTRIDTATVSRVTAFKTGDRARLLPDGKIDLLGRADRQIKINGIRIEPQEIEQGFLRSGLVKNVLVTSHRLDGAINESLIAFFVLADVTGENEVSQDDVKAALSKYLPSWMIPSVIKRIDSFPKLSNGKTDLKKLLDLLNARTICQPVNDVEEKLLSIWKEIFGGQAISTEDSFQQIGGNSLSILALVSRIYKEFEVRFSLVQIFGHPSIKQQATYIAGAERTSVSV